MEIRVERFKYGYFGHWEECGIEEVYSDDFIIYVDGEQVEAGALIKSLLERIEGTQ